MAGPSGEGLLVILNDQEGKTLMQQRFPAHTTPELNISSLAPGLYLVRLVTAEEAVVRKIVKW